MSGGRRYIGEYTDADCPTLGISPMIRSFVKVCLLFVTSSRSSTLHFRLFSTKPCQYSSIISSWFIHTLPRKYFPANSKSFPFSAFIKSAKWVLAAWTSVSSVSTFVFTSFNSSLRLVVILKKLGEPVQLKGNLINKLIPENAEFL